MAAPACDSTSMAMAHEACDSTTCIMLRCSSTVAWWPQARGGEGGGTWDEPPSSSEVGVTTSARGTVAGNAGGCVVGG